MTSSYVVNIHHKAPYDVYAGRGHGLHWGNPYSHQTTTIAQFKVATRDEAITRFREWLEAQPALVERAKRELKGKVLGCFCRPAKGFQGRVMCHAQILAGIANGVPPESIP